MTEPTDLSFVPSEELWEELSKRFDHAVFAATGGATSGSALPSLVAANGKDPYVLLGLSTRIQMHMAEVMRSQESDEDWGIGEDGDPQS